MSDYISREAAKKFFLNLGDSLAPFSALFTPEEVVGYLDEIPAADVAPVRYGRPLNTVPAQYYGEFAECSVCGWFNVSDAKYCNSCGARLDGGVDDEV